MLHLPYLCLYPHENVIIKYPQNTDQWLSTAWDDREWCCCYFIKRIQIFHKELDDEMKSYYTQQHDYHEDRSRYLAFGQQQSWIRSSLVSSQQTSRQWLHQHKYLHWVWPPLVTRTCLSVGAEHCLSNENKIEEKWCKSVGLK